MRSTTVTDGGDSYHDADDVCMEDLAGGVGSMQWEDELSGDDDDDDELSRDDDDDDDANFCKTKELML